MGATAPAMAPPAPPSPTAAPPAPGGGRLRSVDIVRGLACVLMAIDHVRVYSGIPAGGPTPGVFFTRWVTHFVAPAFALYAGTGAFFLGRKLGDPAKLARFLVSRGLLLVVLEITVIRFFWTFGVDYSTFVLAGVIWMLGWCMVLLAAFVRLPAARVGWIGVGIVLCQQVLAFVPRAIPEAARAPFGWFWEFIYASGNDQLPGVSVLYVIVPWIGVMMAGYGLGTILLWDDGRRRRALYRMGLGFIAVFLVVAVPVALARGGAEAPPFFVRVLNQQKYPASQLFLLMTLGPMIALMPWAERARGFVADALDMFGRVPMFYYLLHIPAIHLAAVIVMRLRGAAGYADWFSTAPYTGVPEDQRWNLGLLYAVYAVVLVVVLYPACRWYARYKATHRHRWLTYI
ncbi:MAG: heparan-alpha-glucosaminide N-acetyltransferase domain-containing protein [Gemmatimonadota bacterium]|nr:heparan-alpha-glucosaminide N-acetyltransferase domain-containing protein [Gemmatimonadota bacterium]